MAQQTFNDGELRSSIRSKLNQNATETQSHVDATNNPHAVTAAQVGLWNADVATPALRKLGNYFSGGIQGMTMPGFSPGTGDFTIFWGWRQDGPAYSSFPFIASGAHDFAVGPLDHTDPAVVGVQLDSENTKTLTANRTLGANEHFVFTFDRDGNLEVFINGVLQGTIDLSGEAPLDYTGLAAQVLYRCPADWYYVGVINRALTTDDVDYLYKSGGTALLSSPPELDADCTNYYRFNQPNESGGVRDLTPNGNDLSTSNPLDFQWVGNVVRGHTHDDRYYTEGEVDGFLSGKLANLSDDTTPTLGGDLDGGGNEVWNFANRIVTESGTAVTLGASHYGTVVNFTSATAVAVTVPDTIPAGTTIGWIQSGAGALTFSGSGTMVVNNLSAETDSAGQYAQGSLFVVSSTSAILSGETA